METDYQPTAFHKHVSAVQDLRDQIDARISALAKEIRNLRTQRNQLSPISNLPVEIFRRIVHLVVSFDSTPGSHGNYVKSYRQHAALSRVCKNWWEMVTRDHRLWAHISQSNFRFIPELLRRSGDVPLSVRLDGMTCSYRRDSSRLYVELISQHQHRIQDFLLDFDSAEIVPTLLWNPAPIMRSCKLRRGWINVLPSQALFSNSAPLLTNLGLSDIGIDWELPFFKAVSSLRYLKIDSPRIQPSSQQLLDILACMPELQLLKLSSVWPTLPSADPNSNGTHNPKVELPKLQTLVIRDRLIDCTRFVTSLVFPRVEDVQVWCTDDSDLEDRAYVALQSWIAMIYEPHVQGPRAPTGARYLGISYNDKSGYCTIKSSSCKSDSSSRQFYSSLELSGQESRPLNLTIQLRQSRSYTPPGEDTSRYYNSKFVKSIFRLLPSSLLLDCMTFRTFLPLVKEDWEQCAKFLHGVENLKLRGCIAMSNGLTGLLDALDCSNTAMLSLTGPSTRSKSRGRAVQSSIVSHEVLFPALLSVDAVHICAEDEWKRLEKILRERKAIGVGLESLDVRLDRNWNEDVMEKVKKKVMNAELVKKFVVKKIKHGDLVV
ncbi:hypothetical protein AX16_009955 [Volvariella volvacea WC 439]|nr:hypothetical protein AX16_009955 [Volvariella volvacea WC 439]